MADRTARLPGFRFEAPLPPRDELPRLDVAVFVGFAASGPLHQPVVVEDAPGFANVFGERLPLAWDAERGERVEAYLPAAVRAFFRNGGRRCWVVRVAGEDAQANRFPIAGLTEFEPPGTFTPAYLQARSPGSWSDRLRAGAALASQPVRVLGLGPGDGDDALRVTVSAPGDVAPGDLLRLTLASSGYVVLVSVQTVNRPSAPSPDALPTVGSPLEAAAAAIQARGPAVWLARRLASPLASPVGSPLSSPVGPGAGPSEARQERLERLPRAPAPLPTFAPSGDYADRLTFELWVRHDDGAVSRLAGLGFASGHPRYWRDLPSDDRLYGAADRFTGPGAPAAEGPWQDVINPRFPLAGEAPPRVPLCSDAPTAAPWAEVVAARPVSLPLADRGDGTWSFMPSSIEPDALRGPDPEPTTGTRLRRDGLGAFSAKLFVEPRLATAGPNTVLAEADFLRYRQAASCRLRGIYAALEVAEEATLVVVPDLVHRPWRPDAGPEPPAPTPAPPPAPPADECVPPRPAPDEKGQFGDCVALAAPTLEALDPAEAGASYTVRWSRSPAALREPVCYVLEEATRDDFGDAAVLYRGTEPRFQVDGRAEGTYFYRVRAEEGEARSPFSAGVGLRVRAPRGALITPSSDFQPEDVLLPVQRALLTLCSAQGELFAVLALPAHYREDAALAHTEQLAYLVGDRDRTLSFGAIYHPWLVGREDGTPGELRALPPDGAACGLIARRSVERGAWIAPANEPLRGPVALAPPLAEARRLELQEGSINVVRHEPRGFLALSANTLSRDPELRPIGVRRLLILLRRLALRRGSAYVFEPNDAVFRRSVQRGFEALLDDLFTRGAFAGATPAGAYQVNVSPPLNTPQSVDAGRLTVELRVAPAQPLTFLTLRLVQRGDRAVAVLES